MGTALIPALRILRVVASHPYAPLIPSACLALLLAGGWAGMHATLIAPAHDRLSAVQAEWGAARARLVMHMEAKRTILDLDQVLATFPVKQEFVPLALQITEDAKRNGVTLPSLSYSVGRPKAGLAAKAVFKGAVTGRYEDLRRFIHELELAEELLFVEDLDVAPSGRQQDGRVTFNIRIATYLRAVPGRRPAS